MQSLSKLLPIARTPTYELLLSPSDGYSELAAARLAELEFPEEDNVGDNILVYGIKRTNYKDDFNRIIRKIALL